MADLVRVRPSRLQRFREVVRSYWMGPILSSDPQASSFFFGGPNTQSGVHVNEFSALNYSAVFAATNAISGDIGSFPLMMYKRLTDGGKDRFDTSPLYRMVHDIPNPEMSSVVWRRTIQAHALTWGNGYSEIQRDGAGRPVALWPLTPDRVTPFRRSADAGIQYRVVNSDGGDTFIDAADMIHVPGLGFDGIRGYSVIAKARESLGLGMASEQFGNTFFGNGATFGGVIAYPGARPPELAEKGYRDSLNAQHQGVGNAHKFLALYNGAKYERLGIPPNDAQFLETRQFQISEVARWFNLPPHKLGDLERATHSNIEQQTIDYYTGTLLPWLKVWEQELFIKLIPASERRIQFFEFVVEGLLRGDTAARGDFNSKQFNTGAITPNEIRESENRNPLKGGDRGFVPMNMIPLDKIDAWVDAEIDTKKASAEAARRPPPAPVKAEPTGLTPAEKKALEDAVAEARKIAQDNEDAKDYEQAQRIAAEQARDAALAEVISLRSTTDGLSLDVVAGQRALREEQDARAETVTALAEAVAAGDQVRAALAQAVVQVEAVTAERDLVANELTYTKRYRDEEFSRAEELLVERHALQIAVDKANREQEAGAVAAAAGLNEARISYAAAIAAALSDNERLSGDLVDAVKIQDELRHAADVTEAVLLELRGQIVTLTGEVEKGVLALTEAREAVGRSDTEREQARAAAEQARATSEATTAAATQMAATLNLTRDAVRSILRDAAARLLTRELDRARKASGSPEKLTKWAEAFYPMHEDVCRATLRPALKAWLVASGTDRSVEQVLDRVIPAYVAESTRTLRGLTAETDGETLPSALERILRRWDAERPDALVDRITEAA